MKNRRRILYIWDADYPWDVRVEKICNTLYENGYEVHIAARNLKRLKEQEKINGLYVHRLKPRKNHRINYILTFPLFISPIWRQFLNNIAEDYQIDVIIARDLPLAPAGIWLGKKHNIPVIFDMAEDYVALIKAIWSRRKFEGFNMVIRNPYFAKLIEKYTFQRIDYVMVVVDEAKEVAFRNGCLENQVTVISNTPSLKLFNQSTRLDYYTYKKLESHFSAIYVGGIQMGRGIQTVIEAIPDIIKEIPEFLFVIVGDGYAKNNLKDLTNKKEIDKYIYWAGWIDHNDVYKYIRASKLGLVPHLVTGHKNTTIPNKIFDYMGYGLPVVASNAKPLSRILKKTGAGLTFKGGDPKDLTKSILKVYNSNEDMGKKGKLAVRRNYNWEKDGDKLLKLIEEVVYHTSA